MKLENITKVIIHWTENDHINKVMGMDDNSDIEKEVDVYAFDKMIGIGAKQVRIGCDKISLSVWQDGNCIAREVKFYLTSKKPTLLALIKSGI